MSTQKRTRYYYPVVAVVALVVSGLGLTASAQQDTSDVLTGCLNEQSGVLRNVAVGTVPIGACNPREAVVTWGQGDPVLVGRVAALEAEVAALEAEVEELQGLAGDVAELQALLAGVERNGDTLTFSGMNVQVVNGTGTTDDSENGLGNVIVGYDTGRGGPKTGSHNVVVGDDHTYTNSSGVVIGINNTLVGDHAFVAGIQNYGSGEASFIAGGASHSAGGDLSFIGGGGGNETVGRYTTVVGGTGNVASAWRSFAAGGDQNFVFGQGAAVVGGYNNSADGQVSFVGGGTNDAAGPGTCAYVAGELIGACR